jgi:hypothetical protein
MTLQFLPIIVVKQVTCAWCDQFKIELKSAQKIIELLQEEINMPNGTVSTDAHHLHHNENSTQLELKKGNWVHVPSSRWKRDSTPQIQYTLPIPTVANRYELLNNFNQQMNTTLNQRLEVQPKTEDRKINIKVRRKHKVLIIGDSHARGCAVEVTPNLDENFEVTDLVMPASRLKSITNAAKKEIATLTRDNVIVVWGGTNDTSKNESSKGLSSFVKNRGHTNVIMNASHRHDLDTRACINREVKVFNRKLLKKMYDYANVIETNLSRAHFTQHRLHMNRLGKELISETISENIKSILTRQCPPQSA